MFEHGKELISIVDEGFSVDGIGHLSFSLCGFTKDTLALHEFCKQTLFNERFSCFFCLFEGMKFENRVWIFPFENVIESGDEQYKKDSKESMN